MGRVYEGIQEKPRRLVAVKVMRPGSVSPTNRRRFEIEADVLGRLQHPCIAQIFFAGIRTIAGSEVPYFVMEHVADALPITEFAKKHNLDTKERLHLFRKLCEAMAHAHASGVIHRDLKPRNVLVGPAGVPKVIDFGVARDLLDSAEQVTALTKTGQLVGTFQYMSPEQLFADPSQVDVRVDVYALGLMLYELLVGAPPYDLRGKHVVEAIRLLEQYKFVPPSLLNRGVRPQVDALIETCLQKDRTRRYANAAELTQALTSCLNDEVLETHVLSRGAAIGAGLSVSPPPNRPEATEILACPHCNRAFRTPRDVLGKKIRCRGCSQIFHVPKDTRHVPLTGAAPLAAKASGSEVAPIAIECMIDGRDARRCPQCSRAFAMKAAFIGKTIRCRGCKASFRVAATVSSVADSFKAPAALNPPPSPVRFQPPPVPSLPPAPPPVPQPQTVFDDMGDVLEELMPGEKVASVIRPMISTTLPQVSDYSSGEIFKVLSIALLAVAIASAMVMGRRRLDPPVVLPGEVTAAPASPIPSHEQPLAPEAPAEAEPEARPPAPHKTPQKIPTATFDKSIQDAYAALQREDSDAADQALAEAKKATNGNREAIARVGRWQLFADYARNYFEKHRADAFVEANRGREYELDGQPFVVIEVDRESLLYLKSGRRQRVPREELDPRIELAIVEKWFKGDGRPANHIYLGVRWLCLKVPDRDRGRSEWQIAATHGAPVAQLLPLLDDPVIQGIKP